MKTVEQLGSTRQVKQGKAHVSVTACNQAVVLPAQGHNRGSRMHRCLLNAALWMHPQCRKSQTLMGTRWVFIFLGYQLLLEVSTGSWILM